MPIIDRPNGVYILDMDNEIKKFANKIFDNNG